MLCVYAQNSKATENLLAMEYLLWHAWSRSRYSQQNYCTLKTGVLKQCPGKVPSLIIFFSIFWGSFQLLCTPNSLVLVILVSILAFCCIRVLSSTEIGAWSWMLWNISFSSSKISKNFEGSRLEFIVWQICHCSVVTLNKINALNWSIIRLASCLVACRLYLVTRWFYQQQHCWRCQRETVDSETERLLHLSWLFFRPEMKLCGGELRTVFVLLLILQGC